MTPRRPDERPGSAHQTFTDLFLQTMLTRLPHNFTQRQEYPARHGDPRSLCGGRRH